MTSKLKQYFPMIRTRQDVLLEIHQSPSLQTMFQNWTADQQCEFLDFCTGMRGVKILYDTFFKEIMNPQDAPERLNDFLSLLLHTRIEVLHVMEQESRLENGCSLIIMDIVAKLTDGSLINVEVQKYGYKFPGQRGACYSSDLLLRQYHQLRSEKKREFSYRDVKPVYTIVFFENNPPEFHAFPDKWIHEFRQQSNSGLELDLLQKYVFIPLDIFRQNHQNKVIVSKLDAWLAFLCMDDPEVIIQLITGYPGFRNLYEEIYTLCLNVEGVMRMFSKELQLLDKNTVQLMLDEMHETIAETNTRLQLSQTKLKDTSSQLEATTTQLQNVKAENDSLHRDAAFKLIRQVCQQRQAGKSPEEIASLLLEDPDAIESVCEAAAAVSPPFDPDAIYEMLYVQELMPA